MHAASHNNYLYRCRGCQVPLLGDKLKELRGTRSLYEVGKACKLIPNDVSRYEKGKRVPTPEVLERLANYYGITYKELRKLYYSDILANDEREKEVIVEWVMNIKLSD